MKLQNIYVMKIENKLRTIFLKNSSVFPLGYQYISASTAELVEGRISLSESHNSNFYVLSDYHKPTSIIFSDEQK